MIELATRLTTYTRLEAKMEVYENNIMTPYRVLTQLTTVNNE